MKKMIHDEIVLHFDHPDYAKRPAHKRHHDAMDEFNLALDHLGHMAEGAYAMGMNGTGAKLDKIAEIVSRAKQIARTAFSDEFHEHHQSIMQGTSNMIGAVVAMTLRQDK
jgi:hypothetical protein